jgi:hypothetical protein
MQIRFAHSGAALAVRRWTSRSNLGSVGALLVMALLARAEEAQSLRHFGVDSYWHSVRGGAVLLAALLPLTAILELGELTHFARNDPLGWSLRTFAAILGQWLFTLQRM